MNRNDPNVLSDNRSPKNVVMLKDRSIDRPTSVPSKRVLEIAPEWKKDRVAKRIRSIQRRERLYQALAILTACACTVIVYLFAEIAIDRAWQLEASVRAILLNGALFLLGVGTIVFGYWRWTHPVNPLKYAREADRALGIEDDVLITYVDLARRKNISASERTVVEMLEEDAFSRLKRLDVDHVINTQGLTWAGRILGALCLMWIVYAFMCGSTFFLSFKRAVTPWRNVTVPHQTRILNYGPGSINVLPEESVTFWLQANGVLPDEARLVYRTLEGKHSSSRKSAPMEKASSGKYSVTLSSISKNISYRLYCNDSKTKPKQVSLVARPMVTSVTVKVSPPSYAKHLKTRTITGGHVSAMKGSRIKVFAQVNQEPMGAAMKHVLKLGKYSAWLEMGGRKIPMKAGGQDVHGSFILQRSATYQIRYLAKSGFVSSNGVKYQAKVLEDKVPSVSLVRADAVDGTPLGPKQVAIFNVNVKDDFGVRKVFLRYGIKGRAMRTMDCSSTSPSLARAFPLTLDISTLDARNGQTVVCALHAEDIHRPVPNRGKSAAVLIPILTSKKDDRGDSKAALKKLTSDDPFKDLIEKLKDADRADQRQAALNAAKDSEASKRASRKDGALDDAAKGNEAKQSENENKKRNSELKETIQALQQQEEALLEKMKAEIQKEKSGAPKDEKMREQMMEEQQRIAKQLAHVIKAMKQGGKIPKPGTGKTIPKDGDVDLPAGVKQKQEKRDSAKPSDAKPGNGKDGDSKKTKAVDGGKNKSSGEASGDEGKNEAPGNKVVKDTAAPSDLDADQKNKEKSAAGQGQADGPKSKKGAVSKDSDSGPHGNENNEKVKSATVDSKKQPGRGSEGESSEGEMAHKPGSASGDNKGAQASKLGGDKAGSDSESTASGNPAQDGSGEAERSGEQGSEVGSDAESSGSKSGAGADDASGDDSDAKAAERPNGRQKNAQGSAEEKSEAEHEKDASGQGDAGDEGDANEKSSGDARANEGEGGDAKAGHGSESVNGRQDKRSRDEQAASKNEGEGESRSKNEGEGENGDSAGRPSELSSRGAGAKAGKAKGEQVGEQLGDGNVGDLKKEAGGRGVKTSGESRPLSAQEKDAVGRLIQMQEQMAEAVERLRNRSLDMETLGLSEGVAEGLNGFGRSMSEFDKKDIRNVADEADAGDAVETELDGAGADAGEKGRVRKDLLEAKGSDLGAVRSSGDIKVDKLKRLIEAGQKKVVPEYRRPLEDYYKAIAD